MTKASSQLQSMVRDGLWDKGSVHDHIHHGRLYSGNLYDRTVAASANLDALVVTPASPICHMRMIYRVGGDSLITIYEDVIVSANGSPVGTYNRNRLSSNVSGTLIYEGPTLSSLGTPLEEHLAVGGSIDLFSTGSETSVFEEWIFKPSSKYLIRVNNLTIGAIPINSQLDFYEVPEDYIS